jgi:hypothetical protein
MMYHAGVIVFQGLPVCKGTIYRALGKTSSGLFMLPVALGQSFAT